MTREEAIKIIESNCSCTDSKLREACAMFIPELKESEDEKIRKALIKVFTDKYEKGYEWRGFGIPNRSVLDWLEKQKEQKPIDIDFVSDWLRKHIKTYVNSEYNEFHKTVEYDGSINIERLIEDLKKAIEQQSFVRENDFVSKPAEWSEEDEKWFEEIELMALYFSDDASYRWRFFGWLKSFKDKVQSTPHWRPSEEQMDILDKVYHYLWADRNATADMQDGLGDFIDELKKL